MAARWSPPGRPRSGSRALRKRKPWSRSRKRWSAAPRRAQPASRLWSEPNKKYAAKLREIAPAADPATRTYLAKFSLPDAGDTVSLGMTATLTLADPATTRVARLPLSALYSQGGDPSLYIVDDKGDVHLKPVTVKSYESNDVVISGGVDEGAKVVVLGVQKLDPAQKVRVVSSLSF